MSSYLSKLLVYTTSTYSTIHRTLFSTEDDGYAEDGTRIGQVLRACYTENGQPLDTSASASATITTGTGVQVDRLTQGQDPDKTGGKGLLDLPAEIWSKIGKLVIDDERPTKSIIIFAMRAGITNEQPAITCACRDLRGELLPYLYQTKYQLDLSYLDLDWCMDDVEIIGTYLRAMRPSDRQHIRMAWMDGMKRGKRGHQKKLANAWGVAIEFHPVDCPSPTGPDGARYQIKFL